MAKGDPTDSNSYMAAMNNPHTATKSSPSGGYVVAAASGGPTGTTQHVSATRSGFEVGSDGTPYWNADPNAGQVSAGFNFSLFTGQYANNLYAPRSGPGQDDPDFTNRNYSFAEKTGAADYFNQVAQYSPAELNSLQKQLQGAGFLNGSGFAPGAFDGQTQSALMQAMQVVSRINDPNVTLGKYLQNAVERNAAAGAGGSTVSTTTTSVDLTNPSQAKGLLYSTLQQYLGRMPTDHDVAQFTSALNADEKKNPTVTTSTRTTNGKIDPTTGGQQVKTASQTQKGGVDSSTEAIDYARAQPGSAEFQATQYMDVLEQAIRGS